MVINHGMEEGSLVPEFPVSALENEKWELSSSPDDIAIVISLVSRTK